MGWSDGYRGKEVFSIFKISIFPFTHSQPVVYNPLMTNIYKQEIDEILAIVGTNFEGYERGVPIDALPFFMRENQIEDDQSLQASILELELVEEELDEKEKDVLISALIYASRSVRALDIEINDAIWRKYFMNEYTYMFAISRSVVEIYRHAAEGGVYEDGLFEETTVWGRHNDLTESLRRWAFQNYKELLTPSRYPIGEEDIGVIQLVFKHWLLKTGRTIPIEEMKNRLMGEVNEFTETALSIHYSDEEKWGRALEAADVIIYILHIFTLYDLNIAEVLEDLGKSGRL